jgi:hypothetical protein
MSTVMPTVVVIMKKDKSEIASSRGWPTLKGPELSGNMLLRLRSLYR